MEILTKRVVLVLSVASKEGFFDRAVVIIKHFLKSTCADAGEDATKVETVESGESGW